MDVVAANEDEASVDSLKQQVADLEKLLGQYKHSVGEYAEYVFEQRTELKDLRLRFKDTVKENSELKVAVSALKCRIRASEDPDGDVARLAREAQIEATVYKDALKEMLTKVFGPEKTDLYIENLLKEQRNFGARIALDAYKKESDE